MQEHGLLFLGLLHCPAIRIASSSSDFPIISTRGLQNSGFLHVATPNTLRAFDLSGEHHFTKRSVTINFLQGVHRNLSITDTHQVQSFMMAASHIVVPIVLCVRPSFSPHLAQQNCLLRDNVCQQLVLGWELPVSLLPFYLFSSGLTSPTSSSWMSWTVSVCQLLGHRLSMTLMILGSSTQLEPCTSL